MSDPWFETIHSAANRVRDCADRITKLANAMSVLGMDSSGEMFAIAAELRADEESIRCVVNGKCEF